MVVVNDQHFLDNEEILSKISESLVTSKEDLVVEVGAGKGSLTQFLVKKLFSELRIIEKDEALLPYLEPFSSSYVTIIQGNALRELSKENCNKLIGNIPYAITEPLYQRLLEIEPEQAVFLHGIDFYAKMTSSHSKWSYFVSAFYSISKIMEVSGKEFTPKTKVNSVVVKLEKKSSFTTQELFYRNLFMKRNRIAYNAVVFSLVDTFGFSKNESRSIVSLLSASFSTKKLRQLSNKEFNEIIKIMKSKNLFKDL